MAHYLCWGLDDTPVDELIRGSDIETVISTGLPRAEVSDECR